MVSRWKETFIKYFAAETFFIMILFIIVLKHNFKCRDLLKDAITLAFASTSLTEHQTLPHKSDIGKCIEITIFPPNIPLFYGVIFSA
ncbi:hypothetical protein T10_5880 [Trichinella papuae]|uniref:Uncharacterized protein n=1 Tax=Trichinella papuae TaxID=268474 RepID=A0A0V1N597_9BILA|nr:hypothetical protein T10_5880 [Trichinella papuae]